MDPGNAESLYLRVLINDRRPNYCLKLTACGRRKLRQNSPALARRSLTMRWAPR